MNLTAMDFAARGDGSFYVIRRGEIWELGYAGGHESRRIWRPVEAPFLVALKIDARPDGALFAVDADGAVWQRLADRIETVADTTGRPGAIGTATRSAEWRKVAGPPPVSCEGTA